MSEIISFREAEGFRRTISRLESQLNNCEQKNISLTRSMATKEKKYLKQAQELLLLRRISQTLIDGIKEDG